MYIVAGLGNPGDKYLKNLHNLGFMAVELLAEKNGVSFDKKGFKEIGTMEKPFYNSLWKWVVRT